MSCEIIRNIRCFSSYLMFLLKLEVTFRPFMQISLTHVLKHAGL